MVLGVPCEVPEVLWKVPMDLCEVSAAQCEVLEVLMDLCEVSVTQCEVLEVLWKVLMVLCEVLVARCEVLEDPCKVQEVLSIIKVHLVVLTLKTQGSKDLHQVSTNLLQNSVVDLDLDLEEIQIFPEI